MKRTFQTLFIIWRKKKGIEINLLAPKQSDLLATLISISQSNVQNLIPDLLIVSSETENLISPNFISQSTTNL